MNRQLHYTEAELIKGCQKGKRLYQQELYRKYYRKMLGVCMRYTNQPEDAEDVLQEAFIKVFKHIKGFRGKGSFEGWIRRIMVHTSIEHYRKRSRYFMVEMEQAREVELNADQLSEMSKEEILEVIQSLSVGYRTVFNLYAIEGYSHKEIAEMLGISIGTSKSQYSRAKALLKEKLEQNEKFHAQSGILA
jgi:RNA polymerase sigma-70 factor (ECF subfamily)